MSEDKMRGGVDQAKGTLKETAGNLTGDDRLVQDGKFDQAKGKVEQGVGDLKDAAGSLKDQAADAVDQATHDR